MKRIKLRVGDLIRPKFNRSVTLWRDIKKVASQRWMMQDRVFDTCLDTSGLVIAIPRWYGATGSEGAILLLVKGRFYWTWAADIMVA